MPPTLLKIQLAFIQEVHTTNIIKQVMLASYKNGLYSLVREENNNNSKISSLLLLPLWALLLLQFSKFIKVREEKY